MRCQSVMSAADASTAAVHVLSAQLRDGGPLPSLAQFLAGVPDHRRAQADCVPWPRSWAWPAPR